eukprot:g6093.t1
MPSKANAKPGVKKGSDKLKRQTTDNVLRSFVTKRPQVNVADPLVDAEARKFCRAKHNHIGNIIRDFDHNSGTHDLRNALGTVKKKTGGGTNSAQKADWLSTSGDMTAWHNVVETTSDEDVKDWSDQEQKMVIKRGEELLESCTHWPSLNKMTGLLASQRADHPLGPAHRPKLTKVLVTRVILKCRSKRSYKSARGTVVVEPQAEDDLKKAQKNQRTQQEPPPVFDSVDDVVKWLGKYPAIQSNLGSFYTKMSTESATTYATSVSTYLANPANKPEHAGWKFAKAIQPLAEEAAITSKAGTQDINLGKAARNEPLTAPEKASLKAHVFTTTQILRAVGSGNIFALLPMQHATRTTMLNRVKPYVTQVQQQALGAIDAEMKVFGQTQLGRGREALLHHLLNVNWDKRLPELKKRVEVVLLSDEVVAGMRKEFEEFAEAAKNYATTGGTANQAQKTLLQASTTLTGSYINAAGAVVLLLKPNPSEQQVDEVTAQVKESIISLSSSDDHIGALQNLGDCVEAWEKRSLATLLENLKKEVDRLGAAQNTTVKQMDDYLAKWRGSKVVWAMEKIDMRGMNSLNTWLTEQTRGITTKFTEVQAIVEEREGVAQQPAQMGAVPMDEGEEM